MQKTKHKAGLAFSLSASMMAAFSVVFPSGYSIGAVLLLLVSIYTLIAYRLPEVGKLGWSLCVLMLAYSSYWMANAAFNGADVAAFDQPSRMALAVPVVLAGVRSVYRWSVIWLGIALSGIAVGILGVHEVVFLHERRASGFVGPEHFGNLSVLFLSLSIVGVAWAFATHRSVLYQSILALGIAGGLAGAAASGTRASWIAFAVLILILTPLLWKLRIRRMSASIILIIATGAGIGLHQNDSNLVDRMANAISDVSLYYSDDVPHGSMSKRFEAWKGSAALFSQKPIFGWGDAGYQLGMEELAKEGVVSKTVGDFDHAHNDWFNAAAKRGVIGVLILTGVYLAPLLIFFRVLVRERGLPRRLVASGGVMVSVNFIVYGLAHHALGSNNGIMNYAFWIAVFAGFCLKKEKVNQPMRVVD